LWLKAEMGSYVNGYFKKSYQTLRQEIGLGMNRLELRSTQVDTWIFVENLRRQGNCRNLQIPELIKKAKAMG
jgi:hypothetical protein